MRNRRGSWLTISGSAPKPQQKGTDNMNNKNKTHIKEIFDRLSKSDRSKILELNNAYAECQRLYGEDDSDTISDLESIIRPKALAYAEEVIRKDGVPPHGEGWNFTPSIFTKSDGVIEILLCRTEDNRFIPSTCSVCWDAKAGSVDEGCGVKSPVNALAWGLTEAFAYYLAGDISHLRDGKHFPKLKRNKSNSRKVVAK